MSDTPRTDADQWTVGFAGDDRCVVWADIARQLERELNAERARLDWLLLNATSIVISDYTSGDRDVYAIGHTRAAIDAAMKEDGK